MKFFVLFFGLICLVQQLQVSTSFERETEFLLELVDRSDVFSRY